MKLKNKLKSAEKHRIPNYFKRIYWQLLVIGKRMPIFALAIAQSRVILETKVHT